MATKATLFTAPGCLNNRLFDLSDPVLNHDDTAYCFYLLKRRLAERGVDLSTQDINPPERSEFTIYNEMPEHDPAQGGPRRYLLLLESALIRPDNWDMPRHARYDKIFTWNDDLVDNKRYFKINFPSKLDAPAPARLSDRKLCVVIAGNKYVRSPLELYSKRVEAVRWFENNHPEDFDLYGIGWDAPLTLRSAAKALLQLRPERLFQRFPSYRGTVQSKLETLTRYRFSICYENAQGIPGYITEKAIHCFMAGCVPVYWGPPNVATHIPENAFIDFRKFQSYGELYRRLTTMSEAEYAAYVDAGRAFLNGPKGYAFGCDFFCDQIVPNVLDKAACA